MRATLPLRSAPRTPACPGFGVSGDRKRACFDRSSCWGAVSAERGVRDLSREWGPVGVDDVRHREPTRGRGFERVQMRVGGVPLWAEAPGGMGRPLSIERVQMGWGSGATGSWERCPVSSFERVQMTSAFGLCAAHEPQRIAVRVVKTLRHSEAAQPSQLRPMNTVSYTLTITGECLCHP
jgi:hypothetical protein